MCVCVLSPYTIVFYARAHGRVDIVRRPTRDLLLYISISLVLCGEIFISTRDVPIDHLMR